MAPEAERPSEREARTAIERILDIELQREQPRAWPWVDYSDARGNQCFEVKAVTCEEFRRLDAQIHDEPFFESMVLERRWWVMIDVPTMQDKFQPTPDFPPDPEPATIRCLAEAGLILQSHDDRIAEFEARFSGGKLAVPKVRGLASRLERHLAVLESHSIDCTRGAQESSADLRIALRQISVLTRDAICINHPATPSMRAGVEILFAYGYVRTGPSELAFRVNAWLASDLSFNLRDSLASGDWFRRHAVLVFDSSEPEFFSATEDDTYIPTTPITLPEPIDEVWCILGPVTMRFSRDEGWRCHRPIES